MTVNLDSMITAYYGAFPLAFWLSASICIYALATNLLWLLRSRGPNNSLAVGVIVQAGRLLFYLGIPYLALGGWPLRPFQSLILLKDLGLVSPGLDWPVTRWLQAAGLAVGLGFVAFLLLVLAWRNANQASTGSRLDLPNRPWWALIVDGLCLEIHWAFYRTSLGLIFDDLYAGVVLGLVLVFVEWSISPYWRKGWRIDEWAGLQWLRAGLAVVSALLFLLTRNLWVCLTLHWLLVVAFMGLGRKQIHTSLPQDPSYR
jgi:hypothetical protein